MLTQKQKKLHEPKSVGHPNPMGQLAAGNLCEMVIVSQSWFRLCPKFPMALQKDDQDK